MYCSLTINPCTSVHRSAKSLFEMEHLDDGFVSLRANNGKLVSAHFNGSLCAINDVIEAKNRFEVTIVNRPVLVLMCDFGFVGAKTSGNARLECNKANYDQIFVERANGHRGAYALKGSCHSRRRLMLTAVLSLCCQTCDGSCRGE